MATYIDDKKYSEEEIIENVRRDIGADFLGYNDPENLANAIGIQRIHYVLHVHQVIILH